MSSGGGGGGISGIGGGEDREVQRKKEVEDLITKYTKKKDPSEVNHFT